MLIQLTVPALLCVVGVLMWALCTAPILKRVGEYMFMAGIFAIAFQSAHVFTKL